MRILIAEDEVEIAKALKVILEKNKYSVDIVHNGLDAYDYISQINYDTIVLDIMMPGMDGLTVLKKLRKDGIKTPVLMLTAKAEIEDRIIGLNSGADDYLPKPFASGEFVARIGALCRRSDVYTSDILSLGRTKLDCNSYTLFTDTSEKLHLNNKEFQTMRLFMRHPHFVFSTEHIMSKIWGLDSESEIDVVWTYIGFLRKKLKQINADIEIKTIRGAGYALEEIKC